MAEVKTWFADAVYNDKIYDEAQNEEVISIIGSAAKKYLAPTHEWNCSMISTFGTYRPHEDSKFTSLISVIEEHVNKFARILGSGHNYKCKESWVNVSKKGQYQEYHVHPNNLFSAVYYVNTYENSGDIVFKKMPYETYELKNKIESNEFNYQEAKYSPEPGQLLIFRSCIPHMVTENKSDKNRVSIAFNLD